MPGNMLRIGINILIYITKLNIEYIAIHIHILQIKNTLSYSLRTYNLIYNIHLG